MNTIANAPPKMVSARYMIAGPAACRTALRSFVTPRHEVAGAHPGVVRRVGCLERAEQIVPEVVLDLAGSCR